MKQSNGSDIMSSFEIGKSVGILINPINYNTYCLLITQNLSKEERMRSNKIEMYVLVFIYSRTSICNKCCVNLYIRNYAILMFHIMMLHTNTKPDRFQDLKFIEVVRKKKAIDVAVDLKYAAGHVVNCNIGRN